MISAGKRLKLSQLCKVLSTGLQEFVTDFEKREFGMKTIKDYDFENCTEFESYFKYDNEIGKYYRNRIYRDDSVLIKNIAWNPL
mmetsp:Transcript_19032/g.21353  ORF Transcript_19032/g.21353 Transcript_19032/m.21353 type:complete len:84 (-) Transcript_19032:357-608(-)